MMFASAQSPDIAPVCKAWAQYHFTECVGWAKLRCLFDDPAPFFAALRTIGAKAAGACFATRSVAGRAQFLCPDRA